VREPAHRTSDRGFALVVVLWNLGLLALLVAGLSAAERTQVNLAQGALGVVAAEAAADGAVQRAIYMLRRGAWAADEIPRRVVIGRAAAAVTLEDQGARINPNFSSPAVLAALLGMVGEAPDQAMATARTIVDWRTATAYSIGGGLKLDQCRQAGLPYGPPSRPFVSTDEIGSVPGMTAELMGRLRPFLSVYQTGDPRLTEGATAGRSVMQIAEMLNPACAPVPFGGHGHHRVKVSRAFAVGKVAPTICFPGVDKGDVAAQGVFQQPVDDVDDAGFAPFGEQRVGVDWSVERLHAGAAEAFGQGALWDDLEVQLAGGEKAAGDAVGTDGAADQFAEFAGCQKVGDTTAVAPAGVGDEGHVPSVGGD
jgi:hypothetical protein